MIQIKIPSMNNLLEIKNLILQLGYEVTENDMKSILELYLSNENYKVFVAEIDGKIVGLVAVSFIQLFVKSGKKCTVQALVVDENFRGRKIGHKLMEEIEDFAKNVGCIAIDLTSGKRREKDGTLRFYQSIGYGNDGLMATNYLRKELN